ncbi:MAG: beta-propeller fold lactonase family protein [Candidatus Latescibacterota bacterium]
MSYHVYVSNAGSPFLSHFLMDEDTGRLAPQPNIELGDAPGAAATSAAGTLLFVCLRAAKRFASFSLDRASGRLAPISTAQLAEGAPYVKTDNTERFLLASYYGGGHVSVHRIHDDGSLSAEPLQWIQTAPHAHSIQTDRSNRFAFVPHTLPTNAIYQFRFDEQTGRLTPNDPPRVDHGSPEGPRHFAWHPTRDILYAVNEDNNTVSAFHFDPERGTLAPFQLIGTLPDGFQGKSATAEIKVTPDGRHLYASNRGHESLALFAVQGDGTLATRGHYSTEPTPRFFELDPRGRFLLSAGQNTGRLVSYRIDSATGALEPLQLHQVGASPLWILFVRQA